MGKEALFQKFLPLAKMMALKYASMAPTDYDEMLSAAHLGLVKAINDARRISRRYVAIRIVGEIKDTIRRVHHLPRRDAAFARLYHSFPGTMAEKAENMRLSEEHVFRRMARIPGFVRLERVEELPDPHAHQLASLDEALEVCLPLVPKEAQDVFLRKFREEQEFIDICKEANLSFSQATQLINMAINSLREHKETLANLLLK